MHGSEADKDDTLPANSHWQQCLNFYRLSNFIREENKKKKYKINISIKFNANNKSKLATTSSGPVTQRCGGAVVRRGDAARRTAA